MGRVAIKAFAVLAFHAVHYLLWVMASGAFLNLWGCSCDVPARQKYHRTSEEDNIQQHEKLTSHLSFLPLMNCSTYPEHTHFPVDDPVHPPLLDLFNVKGCSSTRLLR